LSSPRRACRHRRLRCAPAGFATATRALQKLQF
jgi:hypothetical protein